MKYLKVLNLFLFIAVIAVNYLANALPIGGNTTGEVSALYDNLFVPAGWAFSIWGLIYLGLGYWVIRPFFVGRDDISNRAVNRAGLWLSINFLLNMVWLLLWHNLMIFTSIIAMLGILGSLLILFIRIDPGGKYSLRDPSWWGIQAPISLYLGWICVATIANVSGWLSSLGFTLGLAEAQWLAILLVIAPMPALFLLNKYRDPVPALVVLWALAGIYNRYSGRVDVPEYPLTVIVVLCMVVLVWLIWVILFSPYRKIRPLNA